MARYVSQATFDAAVIELTEQQLARSHVTRRFGWKPEAVRVLRRGVCYVTVWTGFLSVELLFAEGLLVGVVPLNKRR